MLLATTAGTWGITGAQFLWGYAALCAATGVGVWHAYRQALGRPAGPLDPLPELSVCEIGILNDGPDCATTAAAARLYYDGLVRGTDGTLVATGELDATADPIEREVYETISREPWLSVDQLRTRVRESAAMRTLCEQMTRAGLLLDEPRARRVRLLWIVPALITALGVLRIIVGVAQGRPVLGLAVMTGLAGLATAGLVALRPVGTRRGQDVLERLRGERDPVPGQGSAKQIALTAALFGVGTLWLAESAIASALGVPREEDPSVGSGGGGGCGGGGCGGGGCGGCGGCGG
jgi:uncharacterized protein (TIGR04222 family)